MNPFRSPWWWAALLAGGSYCLPAWGVWNPLAPALLFAWKGAGVGLLAGWLAALGERRLALVLALGALGDVLLAKSGLLVGALAFAAGHALAIHTYLTRARANPPGGAGLHLAPTVAWAPFAVLIPTSLLITHFMLRGQPLALVALLYAALVAGMAAAAWQSRYPRTLTGLGALLFLVSDWLIFTGQGLGPTLPPAQELARFGVWPLYFGGQALIAAGIATSPANPR